MADCSEFHGAQSELASSQFPKPWIPATMAYYICKAAQNLLKWPTSHVDRCTYEESCGDLKEKHTYRLQSNIPLAPREYAII